MFVVRFEKKARISTSLRMNNANEPRGELKQPTIPRMQTNPFPSMLILLEGKADAKIGGKNIVLENGPMLFIPAGVTHEFWNNHDEAVEFILMMFGEGA